MGDIQLSIFDRRGTIEIEVIRARGLLRKPGSKALPGLLLFHTFIIHWPPSRTNVVIDEPIELNVIQNLQGAIQIPSIKLGAFQM